ncbi:uncharacterized protein LOC125868226 [Solanum stenotomum]|uniref:uncharacterized protein LOC125868226 n=1 Tax=Solanum stenotomum TaxID=172797 RepID=UPI0020D1B7FA|nr:uncharacterized protein LOC125868226 [Solanum stenotomum]
MGKNTSAKGKEKKEAEHNEQDGFSVLSPCKPASSHKEEQSQVELEIRLLEALEIYPLAKLRGIHRHFVLFGLTENLRRSLSRQFTPDDVLKLLDRFYDLNMVKPDDADAKIFNKEEVFCLPHSYFLMEEP